MKRLIQFVVLIGLLAISLTGCGDKNTESAHPKNVDAGHSKPGGDSDTDSSEMNVLHGKKVRLPKKVVAAIESLCEEVPGEDGEYKVENALRDTPYFRGPAYAPLLCFDGNTMPKDAYNMIDQIVISKCSNDDIIKFADCVKNVSYPATTEEKHKCSAILDQCKKEAISSDYSKGYNDFCESAKACQLKYHSGFSTDSLKKDSFCQESAKLDAASFRSCSLEDIKKLVSCLQSRCASPDTSMDAKNHSAECLNDFKKSCYSGLFDNIFY